VSGTGGDYYPYDEGTAKVLNNRLVNIEAKADVTIQHNREHEAHSQLEDS
jgi:hypothetical protein